jgi:cell division cycle protein 37
MIESGHMAEKVFIDDVEKTYNHLVERVRVHHEESSAAAAGAEQIQLVPENPSQSISFNVPDGPPPPNLVLEGPGTENLNVEDVRNMLQLKWDIFCGFSEELQTALKEGTLDGVNRVLGAMPVPEAEQIVQSLDMAGILSFAEGGIRDETGQDEDGDEVEMKENVD